VQAKLFLIFSLFVGVGSTVGAAILYVSRKRLIVLLANQGAALLPLGDCIAINARA
jgi:hypothetical protein